MKEISKVLLFGIFLFSFLLAKGKNKDEVLANALLEPQNFNEFPVGLSIKKNHLDVRS